MVAGSCMPSTTPRVTSSASVGRSRSACSANQSGSQMATRAMCRPPRRRSTAAPKRSGSQPVEVRRAYRCHRPSARARPSRGSRRSSPHGPCRPAHRACGRRPTCHRGDGPARPGRGPRRSSARMGTTRRSASTSHGWRSVTWVCIGRSGSRVVADGGRHRTAWRRRRAGSKCDAAGRRRGDRAPSLPPPVPR